MSILALIVVMGLAFGTYKIVSDEIKGKRDVVLIQIVLCTAMVFMIFQPIVSIAVASIVSAVVAVLTVKFIK